MAIFDFKHFTTPQSSQGGYVQNNNSDQNNNIYMPNTTATQIPQKNDALEQKQPISTVKQTQPTLSNQVQKQQPLGKDVQMSDAAESAKKPLTAVENAIQKRADANDISRQSLMDIMTHMTQRANKILVTAQAKAKELVTDVVDSEHLLHALLADGEVYKLLVELKIQPQIIEQELTQGYKRGQSKLPPQLSPRAKHIIDDSLQIARKGGYEFIAPEHLLLAVFNEGEGMGARILAKLGLTKDALEKKVMQKNGVVGAMGQVVAGVGGVVKQVQQQLSAIQQFTIDVTAKAQEGKLDPCVERSEQIERVIQVLSRRTKNNPALIGEPGVGKTAIVEGLAQKIIAREVPESLTGKRLLQLDLMSVIAGASHRGEFEERMKKLIEEMCAATNIIMFIDEMHTIVGAGAGGDGALDAANFLKPALARGDLQMIGATTITEYRKYIEKDAALERRFQTVLVPEPTEEQAVKMLKALRDKFEGFHKVTIPDSALDAAVKLSKRYVGDRFLPDKAIDLIDEAASAVRLPVISLPEEIRSIENRIQEINQEMIQAQKQGDPVKARVLKSKLSDIQPQLHQKQDEFAIRKAQSHVEVTESTIKDVVSRWTGIPISKLTGSETDKLSHLETIMHERMIGQERPVAAVAAAVRRGRAGLKSNQRPIGSFVFLGPSGVGKTELTKTLAEVLFGREEEMIRFDMTEFMEKHEVAKLLGPPPGYVGYEEGGKLTEAVRRKPYSVVLFDEIEKAHPDIFNILLQVLDDGRLTDNKGRTISFKNTVVICTSNIGTQIIQAELLKQVQLQAQMKESARAEVVEENGRLLAHVVPDVDSNYHAMATHDIAPLYRTTLQNLSTPELAEGHQYEDEATVLDSVAYERIKEMVMGELRKFFRPELINRFDEVIVFEPLQLVHMKQIVKLQLRTLSRIMEEQSLGLDVTPAAQDQIVQDGFDPIYGARPLRRAIQRLLEDPISEMIIAKKVTPGDIVQVVYENEMFDFRVTKPVQTQDSNAEKERLQEFICQPSGYRFFSLTNDHATMLCPIDMSQTVATWQAPDPNMQKNKHTTVTSADQIADAIPMVATKEGLTLAEQGAQAVVPTAITTDPATITDADVTDYSPSTGEKTTTTVQTQQSEPTDINMSTAPVSYQSV